MKCITTLLNSYTNLTGKKNPSNGTVMWGKFDWQVWTSKGKKDYLVQAMSFQYLDPFKMFFTQYYLKQHPYK